MEVPFVTPPFARFVPVVFRAPEAVDLSQARVRLRYPGSAPMGVVANPDGTYSLPPPGPESEGLARLWARPDQEPRDGDPVLDGGDYLAPGEYSAAEFGFTDGGRTVVRYLEAVRPGAQAGDLRIEVEFDLDGAGRSLARDAVRATAVRLGLTPDFDRDGAIDDEDARRLALRGLFRFWINDDRDKGFWGTYALEDAPEGSYAEDGWAARNVRWVKYLREKFFDRERNCRDEEVNGVRDLVDFFPVRLTLPLGVLGVQRSTYRLRQADSAVGFAYTPLDPASVSDLQTGVATNHYGSCRDKLVDGAHVNPVDAEGLDLHAGWLVSGPLDQPDPVVMVEGRAATASPLVLELRRGGHPVGDWRLGLSLGSVSNMFRYLNLRTNDVYFSDHHKPGDFPFTPRKAVEGRWGTRMDDPPNNPDGFYLPPGESQKTVVWVHGVDWDHEETPAGNAEVFKRLFQAGSNARYVGVSWTSDLSRRVGEPLAYGSDVIGAFVVAPDVKARLEQAGLAGADTTVVAHSLGNMLVSSAIADHGLVVGNYVLLNPAVAVESYDGRAAEGAPDRTNMVHPDWRMDGNVYAARLQCANWSRLFPPEDERSALTWDGRFAGVLARTQAYQFYSTGEEVLRRSEGRLPSLGLLRKALSVSLNWLPLVEIGSEDSLMACEFIWVYNEMTKGQPALADRLFIENHDYAGWRFNTQFYVPEARTDDYGTVFYVDVPMSAAQAAGLPDQGLVASPFFDPFQDGDDPDIPGWAEASATLTNGVASDFPLPPLATARPEQIKWHAKFLAEAIPPLSGPAGWFAVEALRTATPTRAFNLMGPEYRDTALWPEVRPGKTPGQQEDQRWLHGDYKDAPYMLAHRLYRRLAEIERQ